MAESLPAAAAVCSFTDTSSNTKWDGYYASADLNAGRLPPWDSNRPCSQLLELLAEESDGRAAHLDSGSNASQQSKRRKTFVDLGCGSGASVCHLATLGWDATGVDVCEKAVRMAQQRWKKQQQQQQTTTGNSGSESGAAEKAMALEVQPPKFVCADFFEWSRVANIDDIGSSNDGTSSSPTTNAESGGVALSLSSALNDTSSTPLRENPLARETLQQQRQFDLVLDCQFFHALWTGDPTQTERLARAIAGCVAPGGKLLLLTGNADDPKGDTGPTRLTAPQVLEAFLGKSSHAPNCLVHMSCNGA